MGRLATGVTIITGRHEGDPCGLTANAVTSLSLNPPLVLVAVAQSSQSLRCLQGGGVFAVNILSREGEKLAQIFASKDPRKFAGVTFDEGVTGAPLLKEVVAHVECRITQVLPGGDHTIIIGEALRAKRFPGDPLLYFSGGYAALSKT